MHHYGYHKITLVFYKYLLTTVIPYITMYLEGHGKENNMLINRKTTTNTYKSGNYNVDIVTTEKDIGAWIWNKDYGIKMHMWSEPIEQTSYGAFLMNVSQLVEEYKKTYQEKYED